MSLILNPYSRLGTFAFIGSCASTSSSLNYGSLSAGSIAAGDLAVYVDYGYGTASAVTPSGFTNHISSGISGGRGMVSSKKLTGSEGSVTGMNADENNKIGLVFRPPSAFTTITAAGIASELTGGNPTSKSCDPSAETTAVVLLTICGQDSGTAAFSTRSPAADGSVPNGDSDVLVAYNVFSSNPASVSYDMNDLGDMNWLAGLYFTVA